MSTHYYFIYVFPPPNLPHILTVKTICDTSDSIIENERATFSILEQIGVVRFVWTDGVRRRLA